MTQVLLELLPHYAGPDRATPLRQAQPGDAGMDLYAAEDTTIPPGARTLIPTGIKVALEDGIQLEIRPKSGLALKDGLGLLNSPGTVDSGYRGEIKVIVNNANAPVTAEGISAVTNALRDPSQAATAAQALSDGVANATIHIKRGQKIAQAVFTRYVIPEFQVIAEGDTLPESRRGDGGFGSTGR